MLLQNRPIVEAKRLSWLPESNSGAQPVQLLRSLDFSIAPGERLLLTGPSGSGKSTLLRAIAGVLQQTESGNFSGELYVRGRAGLLLQDPANSFVAAHLGSEVAFGPENLALRESEIRARVANAITAVALPYEFGRPTNQLSGGESQRMALAGILAMAPDLLLLDEPTSMLDAVAATNVLAVIAAALAKQPETAAVIVDHDANLWRELVSRVLVLDSSGALVEDLPIETFLARQASQNRPAEQLFDLAYKATSTGEGKITALVGPSGAGKTTELIRQMAQLRAAEVGWVPQQAEFTVAGNTLWQSATATVRNLGLDTTLASRLIAQLGLQSQIELNPYLLSGGELRRLALVSALAHNPSHLMLDEPTVGQDAETWQAVAAVVLAARQAGVLVTMATHDARLIALADEVVEIAPTAVAPMQPERSGNITPLAALGLSFGLLASSFAIANATAGALALGVETALALACWRILPQQKAKRFAPILIALASIWLSNALFAEGGITSGGFERATLVTLRVAFFALPSVALAKALRPTELAAALVKWCRLPARPAVAAAAALVRLEFIQWQWAAVRSARRLRGFSEGRGPLARTHEFMASLFALLVQSLRSAGELAVAMQARGFAEPTAKRRTWVKF